MAVIIYSKKSWRSGKLLGKLLGIPASKPKKLKGVPDVMIRWGCTKFFYEFGNAEIQPLSALELTVNKRLALGILKDNGVSIPEFSEIYLEAEKFPVYARTDFHTKGNGLWFCNNRDELRRAFYSGATHWLEAITEPRVEYRIHIGRVDDDYRILYRQRKFHPTNGNTEDGDERQEWDRVRNFRNGWRFSSIPRVNRESARVARAAVSTLGLDFGAVDVIRTEDRRAFVLEVNTAPALVFRGTIMAYVRYFEEVLGIEADPANVETIIQRMERK